MKARDRWAAPALLAAAALAAYGMTLAAPVIGDDLSYVRDNAAFGLPFGVFLRALLSSGYFRLTVEGTYQPLATLFHYFAHDSPPAYRLAGIALHALNSYLVFLVGRRLIGRDRDALLAALLFCLFPASTETVNVSAFKGHLLACAFTLGALLAWMRALAPGGPDRRAGGLALALCALALLGKETGVLAPALLGAYSLCFARRRFKDFQLRTGAALLVLACAYLWFRFRVLEPAAVAGQTPPPVLSLLGWYARMLAVPGPLCLQRDFHGGPGWAALGAAFLAAGVGWRWSSRFGFYWLWILLAVLPFLGLLSAGAVSPGADRYLYLAAAGFSLVIAEAFGGPRAGYVLWGLILAWGSVTLRRNGLYRDPRALAEQTVACAPEGARALAWRGGLELSDEEFSAARDDLSRAARLEPASATAWNNLGIACYRLKDFAGSAEAFEKALALGEDAPRHDNLGNALAALRRDGEAYEHYQRAWELAPGWDQPYLNAAVMLKTKDPKKSKELALKAQSLTAP